MWAPCWLVCSCSFRFKVRTGVWGWKNCSFPLPRTYYNPPLIMPVRVGHPSFGDGRNDEGVSGTVCQARYRERLGLGGDGNVIEMWRYIWRKCEGNLKELWEIAWRKCMIELRWLWWSHHKNPINTSNHWLWRVGGSGVIGLSWWSDGGDCCWSGRGGGKTNKIAINIGNGWGRHWDLF